MPKTAHAVEVKPWGHDQFIPIRGERGITALEDLYGQRWDSVREAFWVAELHMCGCSVLILNQQLGHMGHVLAASGEAHRGHRRFADIFGPEGSIHFMLYMHWLAAYGFVECGDTPFDQVQLSDHGRSVLQMIQLTRPNNPMYAGPRWFPEPTRKIAPRYEERRDRKRLPPPALVPA